MLEAAKKQKDVGNQEPTKMLPFLKTLEGSLLAWLWIGDVPVQVQQRSAQDGMSTELPLELCGKNPAKAAPWQQGQKGWACLFWHKKPLSAAGFGCCAKDSTWVSVG